MRWLRWVIVALALSEAGWMAFDGTRALVVGDYITPSGAGRAGQLGPWAGLISLVGIDPRSTGTKIGFAVYGAIWLSIIAGFARRTVWGRGAMAVAAAGSLWYLPVGTFISTVLLVLLLVEWRRGARPVSRPLPG